MENVEEWRPKKQFTIPLQPILGYLKTANIFACFIFRWFVLTAAVAAAVAAFFFISVCYAGIFHDTLNNFRVFYLFVYAIFLFVLAFFPLDIFHSFVSTSNVLASYVCMLYGPQSYGDDVIVVTFPQSIYFMFFFFFLEFISRIYASCTNNRKSSFLFFSLSRTHRTRNILFINRHKFERERKKKGKWNKRRQMWFKNSINKCMQWQLKTIKQICRVYILCNVGVGVFVVVVCSFIRLYQTSNTINWIVVVTW